MKRAGLVLVLALLGAARAQDAEADAAASELIASKVFATAKLPAEQWVASYGGSCFVSALRVSVLEKDEAVSGLRRVEILRVFSREKENPRRNVERWWFDEKGLVVLGEKRFYDEPGKEESEPRLVTLYRFKSGKLTVREADQQDGETQDVPAGFVPDAKLAVLCVPDAKGKRYRFATLDDRDEFLWFTIEDLGAEKVTTRSGEVGARKLRIKSGPEEELDWVADGRIVAQRWPRLPNMQSVAGTEAESRTDWSARPVDDADKAADRLATGPARLEALVGELSWANYENGQKASLVRAKITKEEKGFTFAASTSYVSSSGLAGTWALEEWTFSPDGKLVSASRKLKAPDGPELEGKLRVEGDKILATHSLAPPGQEEVALVLPPRIIAESSFVLRAVAGEKGAFRWNGINLDERSIYSVYLAPGDEETIALPGGPVKARRIDLAHGYEPGRAWVDASGKPLLEMWQNGDVSVFGPEDRLPDTLPRDLGPQKKEDR